MEVSMDGFRLNMMRTFRKLLAEAAYVLDDPELDQAVLVLDDSGKAARKNVHSALLEALAGHLAQIRIMYTMYDEENDLFNDLSEHKSLMTYEEFDKIFGTEFVKDFGIVAQEEPT
jgi:hypothetical protein